MKASADFTGHHLFTTLVAVSVRSLEIRLPGCHFNDNLSPERYAMTIRPLVEHETRWEVDVDHPYAKWGIPETMSIDHTMLEGCDSST